MRRNLNHTGKEDGMLDSSKAASDQIPDPLAVEAFVVETVSSATYRPDGIYIYHTKLEGGGVFVPDKVLQATWSGSHVKSRINLGAKVSGLRREVTFKADWQCNASNWMATEVEISNPAAMPPCTPGSKMSSKAVGSAMFATLAFMMFLAFRMEIITLKPAD